MEEFYDGLLNEEGIDEALTHAKRAYLARADEFIAHPRLWAAMVAFGDQQVVKRTQGQWIYISIALIVIFLASYASFKGRRRV